MVEIADALGVLGLSPGASWEETRRAHRHAIVAAHPDAGGTAARAARVNQAFDVLTSATDGGRRPLPSPPPATAPVVAKETGPRRHVRLRDPVEVLMRLSEAAHDIGEVVFVDPDAGLLEVIVGREPGVGQLTASVDTANPDGVPVAFTLEPLGVTPAPPIEQVVQDLMERMQANEQSAPG